MNQVRAESGYKLYLANEYALLADTCRCPARAYIINSRADTRRSQQEVLTEVSRSQESFAKIAAVRGRSVGTGEPCSEAGISKQDSR